MSIVDVFLKLAGTMKEKVKTFSKSLLFLADAGERGRRSWSGFWLGYFSRGYYMRLDETDDELLVEGWGK